MRKIVYLLWSNKHGMWWAPHSRGYTPDVNGAGRYTKEQALERVAQSAMCGRLEQVTCMVAAPDNWSPHHAAAARANLREADRG